MRDIRRPDSLEPLVERLTSAKLTDAGEPVFSTIMDLMIFAAGAGFAHGRRTGVPASGKGVPLRIFENNQKDGYVYMLAMAHFNESGAIAVEKDEEIAKVFEEYAAGGLEIIGEWLNEFPTDLSGVSVLLSQVQGRVETTRILPSDPSPV